MLADPKISLASFASIFLGACAAATAGDMDYGWLTITVLGIFAIEVAKNASGEIFDFNSGNDQAVRAEDRTPFSGGKRVLVDSILTKRQTWGISISSYVVASLAGLSIVIWREPSVLWLGMFGVAIAFFYHAPPIKLSYRGLGELAVAISYGPLICMGTYLVQRGFVTVEIFIASSLLGLLIGSFLIINEFPDFYADQLAQKNNLVVQLGRKRASRIFAGIMVVVFLALFTLPFFGFPTAVWLGFISALPAYSAAKKLILNPETISQIIPAQINTLLTFVLFAFTTGIGLLLW